MHRHSKVRNSFPWAGGCSATLAKQCAVLPKITWHSNFLAILVTAIISQKDQSDWPRSCTVLFINNLSMVRWGWSGFPKPPIDQHSPRPCPGDASLPAWNHPAWGTHKEFVLSIPHRACRLCLGPVSSMKPPKFPKKDTKTCSMNTADTWYLFPPAAALQGCRKHTHVPVPASPSQI